MAGAREDHPHLPPGREPGAQSRRRRLGRTLGGCAAPALAAGGLLFAALVAALGVLLGSISGGPPAWPFFVGALGVLVLFGGLARGLWRGAHPRYARGLSVAVERTLLRRGERIAAVATGDGELEVGLVCVEYSDVWRRVGADDTRSRVTASAVVCEVWQRAPLGALGQRVELPVPADAPYSYEGDCLSFAWSVRVRRVGDRRVAPPVPVWVEP